MARTAGAVRPPGTGPESYCAGVVSVGVVGTVSVPGCGVLAMIILAPLAATILQLAVSRQREYLADATGAQLLGRAAPLADALETLERGAQAIPMQVNPATASLYMVNPLPRGGAATLFMTHPPLEERIRRLRALDGVGAAQFA